MDCQAFVASARTFANLLDRIAAEMHVTISKRDGYPRSGRKPIQLAQHRVVLDDEDVTAPTLSPPLGQPLPHFAKTQKRALQLTQTESDPHLSTSIPLGHKRQQFGMSDCVAPPAPSAKHLNVLEGKEHFVSKEPLKDRLVLQPSPQILAIQSAPPRRPAPVPAFTTLVPAKSTKTDGFVSKLELETLHPAKKGPIGDVVPKRDHDAQPPLGGNGAPAGSTPAIHVPPLQRRPLPTFIPVAATAREKADGSGTFPAPVEPSARKTRPSQVMAWDAKPPVLRGGRMNPAWEDDIVRAFETARAKGPVNCDIRMFFKPAGGTIVFREEDKLEWLDAVSVLTKKAVPKGRMLEEDAVTIFSDIGGDYAKEHIAAILRRTLRLLHHARTKASSVALKPLQATS